MTKSAKKNIEKLMEDFKKVKSNTPLAYIELNIGNGKKETIMFCKNESYEKIAEKVGNKYGIFMNNYENRIG